MQEQTDIGLTQEKDWTDACRVNGISVLTTKDDIWGRRGFWFVDGVMAGRWAYDRLDKKWNFLPEGGMLDKTDMRIASVNGYVDDNGFHNRNLEDVIDEIIFRQRLARQAQDAEQAGLVLWVAADKDGRLLLAEAWPDGDEGRRDFQKSLASETKRQKQDPAPREKPFVFPIRDPGYFSRTLPAGKRSML